MENWKAVFGYEGIYEVSDLGRVRSLDRIIKKRDRRSQRTKGRILKLVIDIGGYARVSLCRGGAQQATMVHRLVVKASRGEIGKGLDVHHIDHNPSNNRLSNLKEVTKRENQQLRNENNNFTSKYSGVSKHRTGKWMAQISINREPHYLGVYESEQEAAEVYRECVEDFAAIAKYKFVESKYVGVTESRGSWRVRVKGKHIGTFKTREEAYEARQNYLATLN